MAATTTHRARHVKAALRAASKDKERPHLQQVIVTETRVEATNGHMLVRIDLDDDAGEREAYRSACSSAAARDVCRGGGVEVIQFNAADIVGLSEQDDGGDRRSVVSAPIGTIQGILDLPTDNVIPKLGREHRKVGIDPKLMAEACKAMAEAGCREVLMSVGPAPFDPILLTGIDADGNDAVVTAVVMPLQPKEQKK